jgi:hypothetical protein
MAPDSQQQPLSAARRRRSAPVTILALAALAFVLAAVVVLGLRAPTAPSVRLSDGSTVSLEAVTFGAEQRLGGGPLQRMLYSLLRSWPPDRFGVSVYRGSAPGVLAYWTRRKGQQHGLDSFQATVFDELGNESPASWAQGLGSGTERYEFRAFPRRGRIAGLRFYLRRVSKVGPHNAEQYAWEKLGEIRAPNPLPPAAARWSPPPLPASAGRGETRVTLTQLQIGVRPDHASLLRGPAEEYCEARLRLGETGPPPPWSASIVEVSDASGNTWPVTSSASDTRNGEVTILFPACPWPSEEAWKLRLRLLRTAQAVFGPDELWEVRGIPLPAAGKQVALVRRKTLQGTALELVAIRGKGAAPPGNLIFWPSPTLRLARTGAIGREVYHQVIRSTDERGRPVEIHEVASTGDSKGTTEVLEVKAPPRSRSVNLTFAVQKPRFVDLLVPKPATSGAAGSR